jgi:hypothetical protein
VSWQLFLLTPWVAAAAVWSPRATLALLAAASLLSALLATIYAYRHEWSVVTYGSSDYLSDYYVVPWFRAPPSLVGMMLAIVWSPYYHHGTSRGASSHRMMSPQQCGGWRRVHALFALSLLLMGLVVYGQQGAYTEQPPRWSRLTMSVYIGLSKPTWALGLASMCHLLFLGEGGLLRAFLQCQALTVLSRLVYCAYLVHCILIFWAAGELLGPLHYTRDWLALLFMGFLTGTVGVAAAVHLLVSTIQMYLHINIQ